MLVLTALIVTFWLVATTKAAKIAKSVEKGFRCNAEVELGRFRGKGSEECEGGLKLSVDASAHPQDTAQLAARELAGQVLDSFFGGHGGDVDDMFLPNDDVLNEWIQAEGLLGGGMSMSKTIEFGGKANVDFGCKVTFEYNGGEFSKDVDCGFKLQKQGGFKK